MIKKPKFIITLIVTVIVLILVLQNTEPVDTQILLWDFPMSRALLLIITFLIGFTVGAVSFRYLTRRKH